jgi:GT2 family glycosyltransferase
MNITTIIPVYKNTKSFLKLFKANYDFLKETKIILIDDDSGESFKEEIDKNYTNKDITVLTNIKNIGYAASVNKGIKMAETPYILLLNSDVKLLDTSYLKAIQEFKDENLFAVSFQQIEKDKSYVGKNRLYFKRGMIFHSSVTSDQKGKNGWAEGGSCMIRKEYFDQLAGFDLIFKPFYWEDIDLSYRAYKRGWHVLFDPEITVEHHHESTIGKLFDSEMIKTISFRNQFLFIWKNITDTKFIISHIVLLPINCIYYLIKGEPLFIKGLFSALSKLKLIMDMRNTYEDIKQVSDREILKQYE